MSVYTLVAGLVVAGATRIHLVLGRMMLAAAWAVLILLAFAPEMHIVISLLGAFAVFRCHTALLPEERQHRAEEAAARRRRPYSPRSSGPRPPPRRPMRPATPAPAAAPAPARAAPAHTVGGPSRHLPGFRSHGRAIGGLILHAGE